MNLYMTRTSCCEGWLKQRSAAGSWRRVLYTGFGKESSVVWMTGSARLPTTATAEMSRAMKAYCEGEGVSEEASVASGLRQSHTLNAPPTSSLSHTSRPSGSGFCHSSFLGDCARAATPLRGCDGSPLPSTPSPRGAAARTRRGLNAGTRAEQAEAARAAAAGSARGGEEHSMASSGLGKARSNTAGGEHDWRLLDFASSPAVSWKSARVTRNSSIVARRAPLHLSASHRPA
jgi:hypothetical protein